MGCISCATDSWTLLLVHPTYAAPSTRILHKSLHAGTYIITYHQYRGTPSTNPSLPSPLALPHYTPHAESSCTLSTNQSAGTKISRTPYALGSWSFGCGALMACIVDQSIVGAGVGMHTATIGRGAMRVRGIGWNWMWDVLWGGEDGGWRLWWVGVGISMRCEEKVVLERCEGYFNSAWSSVLDSFRDNEKESKFGQSRRGHTCPLLILFRLYWCLRCHSRSTSLVYRSLIFSSFTCYQEAWHAEETVLL